MLFRGLHNFKRFTQGCVLTIGNFDGLHLGHQQVLANLKSKSKALGLPSVVMMFEPQPKEFFDPDDAPARLSALSEKLTLLLESKIDAVACIAFNRRLKGLSAQQFVQQLLVSGLNVKSLIVGDDFRFGCDRSGDFAYLEQAGGHFGFTVEDTQTLQTQGERVSSTWVRQCLAKADLEQVEALLGRAYSITGRVAHGQKLGRQLGVPTANVMLKRTKSPLNGVFAVKVTCKEASRVYQGVANIGLRPTVGGSQAVLEVHIFEYTGDLYGKRLTVTFLNKIRDEKRFDGLDALKTAIEHDIQQAKAYFASC